MMWSPWWWWSSPWWCRCGNDDHHHCGDGDDNLDDDCPGLALMGASLSLHSQSCTTVGGKNLVGNNLHELGVKRKLILKDNILGWKTRLTMGMMIWWELGWGLAEWWEIYIWWYDDVNIWRMVIFWYDETMTWWYDERAALGLAEWWEIPRCINWGFASGAFRFSPHTIPCLARNIKDHIVIVTISLCL